MLKVENLTGGYGAINVLENVTLDIGIGETVTIIGANTAGKTSLLRAISGMLPRYTGSITFEGDELLGRPAHTIPQLGIGHVPEGRHIFPQMRVEDNLLLGAYVHRKSDDLQERLENIFQLFPRLRERRNQLAGSMSGGEQQMVAIGRALMSNPQLLLMDEPSLGLAPLVVNEVHEAILKVNAMGVAVLLVEQNAMMALSVASRGYVLESGKVVLQGKASDLKTDPEVRRAYLGI